MWKSLRSIFSGLAAAGDHSSKLKVQCWMFEVQNTEFILAVEGVFDVTLKT